MWSGTSNGECPYSEVHWLGMFNLRAPRDSLFDDHCHNRFCFVGNGQALCSWPMVSVLRLTCPLGEVHWWMSRQPNKRIFPKECHILICPVNFSGNQLTMNRMRIVCLHGSIFGCGPAISEETLHFPFYEEEGGNFSYPYEVLPFWRYVRMSTSLKWRMCDAGE